MSVLIPSERVESKIYLIRGQKVMIDRDLAELYEVSTKRLKEQVRRNLKRFPKDFIPPSHNTPGFSPGMGKRRDSAPRGAGRKEPRVKPAGAPCLS